jgi:hypothetical protein
VVGDGNNGVGELVLEQMEFGLGGDHLGKKLLVEGPI